MANPTYKVFLHDGTSYVEVTNYVASWSSQRGRSRELDTFSAGSFTITLRNYDGRFLPEGFTGTTSPYGADVAIPGRWCYIQVLGDGVTQRTIIFGTIQDTQWRYDNQRIVGASLSGIDVLGQLARYSFTSDYWINASPRTIAYNLLSQAGWDVINDTQFGLTAGSTQDTAYIAVTAGQNTLAACQRAVESEGFARFFADRNTDDLVWQGRYHDVASTSTMTFGDGAGDTPIESVDLAVGSDLLFNQVIAGSPATASPIVEEDATSQTTYGVRSLSRTSLLYDHAPSVKAYAEAHLAEFKDPQARLSRMTINLYACTGAQADDVCERDIGHMVTVTFTPRGAGEVDLDLMVEGIAHAVSPDVHRVTFQLSPAPAIEQFELDTDQLDVDKIGF